MSNIVPFGKHKGKTVEEIIIMDPQYADWALAQAWFLEKFAQLAAEFKKHSLSQDTPQHNAMQARFLDEDIQRQFAKFMKYHGAEFKSMAVEFEYFGVDVAVHFDRFVTSDGGTLSDAQHVFVELKPSIGDDYPSVIRQVLGFRFSRRSFDGRQRIFPLSEMGTLCVVYDEYTGTTVNEKQMRAMMKHSGIECFPWHELER